MPVLPFMVHRLFLSNRSFYVMTKLIFRSAIHYDTTLAQLAGRELSVDAEKELDDFVIKIQKVWSAYNDNLFSYYESIGLTLPEVWNVYPIHSNGKITSFAEPTTIIMRENKEEVIATLVHELCHVFCSFDQNDAVISPMWKKISEAFLNLDEMNRSHIMIIVLARAGLRKILEQQKTEELLSLEKEYPGLDKAWAVIDASKDINAENPFYYLEELVRRKEQ